MRKRDIKGLRLFALLMTDCLETLEEIAMEGKKSSRRQEENDFEHIPCLLESQNFIEFLVYKVHAWQNGAYDNFNTEDPVIIGTQPFSKFNHFFILILRNNSLNNTHVSFCFK